MYSHHVEVQGFGVEIEEFSGWAVPRPRVLLHYTVGERLTPKNLQLVQYRDELFGERPKAIADANVVPGSFSSLPPAPRLRLPLQIRDTVDLADTVPYCAQPTKSQKEEKQQAARERAFPGFSDGFSANSPDGGVKKPPPPLTLVLVDDAAEAQLPEPLKNLIQMHAKVDARCRIRDEREKDLEFAADRPAPDKFEYVLHSSRKKEDLGRQVLSQKFLAKIFF